MAATPSVAKYDPVTASPIIICVTDGDARRRTDVADADSCVNDVCAACRSRKSGSDTTPVISRPLYGVTTTARRSGSRMPWPRRSTPSTTEYMAVVIATPAASDRIANAVNRGVAASRLSANRTSVPIDAERSTAVAGLDEDKRIARGDPPHDVDVA